MSLREVDLALRKISKRKGIEFRLEAALHGVNLGPTEDGEPVKTNITEDQEARAMKSIQETLARKQREAAERGR